jgi:hypothetical protein
MPLDQKFMTHLPSLFAVLLATDGPVLEIGCGLGSTPILRAYCQAAGRVFLSVESDKDWAEKVGAEYMPNYDGLPALGGHCSGFWSVVFVDNAPAIRRGADAMLFKDSAEFVVIHDWESWEVQQNVSLPVRIDAVRFDRRDPQTVTFSTTRRVPEQ